MMVAASTISTVHEQRRAMEQRLATLRLDFPPVRDPVWENAPFPSMVGLYWQLVQSKGQVPSQRDFAVTVAEEMGEPGNPAVIARAKRTYPSLVRQHHFELVLKEEFTLVVHAEEMDLHGIDLLVVERCIACGVCLATNTQRAHDWQAVKKQRHPDPPGLPILHLYVDQNDALRIGHFWLHPPSQVDEVRAMIERARANLIATARSQ